MCVCNNNGVVSSVNVRQGMQQDLFLCAWCKPLDRLRGTQGICPRHYQEVFEKAKADFDRACPEKTEAGRA